MPHLSREYNQDEGPIRFKAPTGLMFEISDIHATVMVNGVDLLIVDRAMEEVGATFKLATDEAIAVIDGGVSGLTVDFQFANPVLTKWITVIQRTSGAIQTWFLINFKFVEVSQSDLIWEYISKNR